MLNKTTEDLLINEIKLLKHIKHENIVEMYDFQVNALPFLSPIPLPLCLQVGRELYLHRHGVLCRR